MKDIIIGIDIDGTTTKIGFFKKDGVLIDEWTIPTDKTNRGGEIAG